MCTHTLYVHSKPDNPLLVCTFPIRYPLSKYFSVVMITVGIALATLASAQQMVQHHIAELDIILLTLLQQEDKSTDSESNTDADEVWILLKLSSGIYAEYSRA